VGKGRKKSQNLGFNAKDSLSLKTAKKLNGMGA
jgi:hypothetical protein